MSKLIKIYKSLPVQIKASFYFLLCSFLQKGISMITTPIFTRLLSTTEYGQYNVFQSWFSVATIFVSLCLTGGVYTQGLVKYESERLIFSSSLQGLSTTLVVLWIIIYLLFSEFWNELFLLNTMQMLAMLIMVWTTSVFNFWANEQRFFYKYKALVCITLIVSLAKPLVGIFFVTHSNDKVTARILGLLVVELVGYTIFFFIQIYRGRKFFYRKFWRYALSFNLPLVPHYLSQTVLSNADRIMISNMVGNKEAGIYSLAYSVSNIMLLLNSALMQTISPWIYQKIKNGKIRDIRSIAYFLLILIAFANLFLIAFAPEVIAIFAPVSYYEAIRIIPPVAMSVYFMFSYELFAKFAFYYEKTKMIMFASIVGALLNIILNYIFIGKWGYIAAGYTTLICYVVYSVGHYIFMNKVCDTYCDKIRPYDLSKILCITIPFVLIGIILSLTYEYIMMRYGIIIIMLIVMFMKRKLIFRVVKNLEILNP